MRLGGVRVTHAEVDEYFDEIGDWMKNDIRREIELARVSQSPAGVRALTDLGIPAGGGNLLAALGLVAYTEALGLLRIWNRTTPHSCGTPSECFLAFFEKMAGGEYTIWWDKWPGTGGKRIYDVLRNGLVHEYRPKVDSEFHIGAAEDLGLGEKDGVLIFRVAPYYRHFCAELDALRAELGAMSDPEIPPPSGASRTGKGAGLGGVGGSGESGPSATRPPIVSPTSSPGG